MWIEMYFQSIRCPLYLRSDDSTNDTIVIVTSTAERKLFVLAGWKIGIHFTEPISSRKINCESIFIRRPTYTKQSQSTLWLVWTQKRMNYLQNENGRQVLGTAVRTTGFRMSTQSSTTSTPTAVQRTSTDVMTGTGPCTPSSEKPKMVA